MKARHGRGVMITRSPLLTGADEPIWAIPAAGRSLAAGTLRTSHETGERPTQWAGGHDLPG